VYKYCIWNGMLGGARLYKMSTMEVTYPNSVVLHTKLPVILDTFSSFNNSPFMEPLILNVEQTLVSSANFVASLCSVVVTGISRNWVGVPCF
jgi:hypothetical protein